MEKKAAKMERREEELIDEKKRECEGERKRACAKGRLRKREKKKYTYIRKGNEVK